MAKVDQESVAIGWLQSRAQGALLLHNSDSFLFPINFPRESRVVRRVAIHEEFSSSVRTQRAWFLLANKLRRNFLKKIGQGEASYNVHLSDV